MNFTKMHGLGNDYVYVDITREKVADPPALARRLADRHTGIGSDGLILIGPSDMADVRMEMYNADGSRAEMCGNGVRCVAKYAVEHALCASTELQIETDAGVTRVWCHVIGSRVDRVRVDMGVPSLAARDLPADVPADRLVDHPMHVGAYELNVTGVSMGNPHAVVFVDQLHRIDLVDVGPRLEHASIFPNRINAHFVRVDALDHVTIRTWERGSGATRACGTGACAACVAGAVTGRTSRTVTAELPGGAVSIEWAGGDHVYMTGPAVEVFRGEWIE